MDEVTDQKVCAACGVDVSDAARMKDVQGRYVCLACADRLRHIKIQKRRAQLAAQSADDTVGMDSTADFELLDDLITQTTSPDRLMICPKCKQDMASESPVCRVCGFDVREHRLRMPGVIESLADVGVHVPSFLLSAKPVFRLGILYIVLFGVLPLVDAFLVRKFYMIPMGGAMVLVSSIILWAYVLLGKCVMTRSKAGRLRLTVLSIVFLPISALMAMFYTLSEGRDLFMRTLAWANLTALVLFCIAFGVDQYLYAKELGT